MSQAAASPAYTQTELSEPNITVGNRLPSTWEALESEDLVHVFHPVRALRRLHLHLRAIALGSSSAAILTCIIPLPSRSAFVKNRPVPHDPQNDRRPVSDEAYSLGSPVTDTASFGTMAHASMGAPDCFRQSSQ